MKNRDKIIFFVISIILSCLVLCYFLTGYYSIDTERIYFQGYTDYAIKDAYIRDGRWISALIFFIVGIFNPTLKTMYIINIILAIIILSASVVQLYDIIKRYKKNLNNKSKFIIFIISYAYIFNFFMSNILQYIDSFVISASILLFILAIKKTIIKKKLKLGFILTLMGVICYQGTIPVYIATAILITILENKKIDKQFFKTILPSAIFIIISSVISLIIVKLVPVITNMPVTDRIVEKEFLSNIIKNIIIVNEVFFYSFNLFPQYLWISIVLLILVISIIYGIKKKNINFSINILFIFIFYILSTFIMLPITSMPRVMLPYAQVISAMLAYSYCTNFQDVKMNIFEKITLFTIIVYSILSIIILFTNVRDSKIGNLVDEQFAISIKNKIEELEKDGEKINKYAIEYTYSGEHIKKYSKNVFYNSIVLRGLYSNKMHEFYTGQKISRVLASEIEADYSNPNNEEIVMKKIDDVLFILIDL